MATSGKKCVFNCSMISEKIIIFEEDKLKKCQHISKVRIAFDLKYSDIVLPEIVDGVSGYHRLCYKAFTSIQNKYLDKYNENNQLEVAKSPQGHTSIEASASPQAEHSAVSNQSIVNDFPQGSTSIISQCDNSAGDEDVNAESE
ncbi:uncharacterized protein LOC128857645 [Anastrepha ludens]|uniref:uncharacterized protein LOC128857645 n=1 Tax=Anastrepha ludens TaxID=28586 RepID=UPI0023AFE7D1|nr:uncharacterized protein LOC128857645 [Anastrepha ludens]